MENKVEARPGVGDTGTGKAETARHALFRYIYSNTKAPRPQDLICDFLGEGVENALTARELSNITGWKRRTVTRKIQRARLAGVPVCASCDSMEPGYFLPDSPEELDRYIRSLRGRLAEVSETLTAVEAGGERWFREGGGADDR